MINPDSGSDPLLFPAIPLAAALDDVCFEKLLGRFCRVNHAFRHLKAGGRRRGLVEEEAEPFSEAGSAMGSEKLQNSLEKVMAIRVGPVRGLLVGWVWLHPNTRPHRPSLRHHSRRTPLRGRFARLARLPHSAAPGGECGARTKHVYRTRFTPPETSG